MASDEPFDLSFNPLDSSGLRVEIVSRRKGVLAVMVDSSLDQMSMCKVSLCDHLTEPRELQEYEVRPLTSFPKAVLDSVPPDTWVLVRKYNWGGEAVLGCVLHEAGANALLTYMRYQVTRSHH